MSKNIYNMSLEELNKEFTTTMELSSNTPENTMIELYGTYTNTPQNVAKLLLVHHLSNVIKEIAKRGNEHPKPESIKQNSYYLEKIATNEAEKVVEVIAENTDEETKPKTNKVDLLGLSKIFDKRNPNVKKLHKKTIAALNNKKSLRAFVFAKELRASRMPYVDIAKELNLKRYKTSAGNRYTEDSVYRLLTYFDKNLKLLTSARSK